MTTKSKDSMLNTSEDSIAKLRDVLSTVKTEAEDGMPLMSVVPASWARYMMMSSPALDVVMKLGINPLTVPPFFPTVSAIGNNLMVSMYDTMRSLESGKKKTMRAGKAIKEICPGLSDDDLTSIVDIIKCRVIAPEVKLAVTASEIECVYGGGPNSCMAGTKGYYCGFSVASLYAYPYDRTEIVPSSGNTLAVAYLGDIDGVKARCVVDVVNKKFARIYGLESQMFTALRALGYVQEKDFILGQKLTRRIVGGEYVCPWIDAKDSDGDPIYDIELPRDQDWMCLSEDADWKFNLKKTLERK